MVHCLFPPIKRLGGLSHMKHEKRKRKEEEESEEKKMIGGRTRFLTFVTAVCSALIACQPHAHHPTMRTGCGCDVTNLWS